MILRDAVTLLMLAPVLSLGLASEVHASKLSEAAKNALDTKVNVTRLGQGLKGEPEILSRARRAFKQGRFKQAAAEYAKIPTTSDRWPIAREELAWTSLRLKEYQMAAAQVRSLTNDYLKTQIDLEPFLLQSIVQLYSCDYNAVFATLGDTKAKMGDYVGGVEALSKGALNENQVKAVEHMMANKTFEGLKPESFHVLPRRFYLDKKANQAIKTANRALLMERLKSMAAAENQRNHKILQHLHLVEVEAIQRAFIPNQFGSKQLTEIKKDKDTMIFNGDQELWADEVDKTQADLFTCDSKTGRTL